MKPTVLKVDNVVGMQILSRDIGAKFSLIYMDPPFFTQREHLVEDRPAFDDRWDSIEHFIGALRLRVEAARDLLAPHGSLVVHLNWRASHYAKVMVDQVFGYECFASEIVWRYRRWPTQTRNFQRVHDVRWVKHPQVAASEHRWNQLYEPIAESTKKTWGTKKQRAVIVDGRRERSSKTDEETKGVPLGDVWDIGIVAPSSRERTGYPTQKPEALLERLILSLTNEGDLILDPYAGSGTTLAVGSRLGRVCWGIDESEEAAQVMARRMGLERRTL